MCTLFELIIITSQDDACSRKEGLGKKEKKEEKRIIQPQKQNCSKNGIAKKTE